MTGPGAHRRRGCRMPEIARRHQHELRQLVVSDDEKAALSRGGRRRPAIPGIQAQRISLIVQESEAGISCSDHQRVDAQFAQGATDALHHITQVRREKDVLCNHAVHGAMLPPVAQRFRCCREMATSKFILPATLNRLANALEFCAAM